MTQNTIETIAAATLTRAAAAAAKGDPAAIMAAMLTEILTTHSPDAIASDIAYVINTHLGNVCEELANDAAVAEYGFPRSEHNLPGSFVAALAAARDENAR